MGEQNAAYLEKINRAATAIEAACGGAEIAVILGSGLGGYAEALENPTFLAYQDIPGFPVSTAPPHAASMAVAARLIFSRYAAFCSPINAPP